VNTGTIPRVPSCHKPASRNRRVVLLSLAFLFLGAMAAPAAVVINEFLAWNWNNLADENGDYEDWIELYNTSATPVYLNGYTLTDDPTTRSKWTFPGVWIPGYNYLLIWASNKNRVVAGSPLHTNFRLDNKGEFIGLYDSAGNPVDSVTYGQQHQDASYGRKPDGSATWMFFTTPTPNASNSTTAAPGFAADPVTTRPAGIYSGSVVVRLSSATPGAQIRYELGGTLPTPASPLYSSSLTFTTPTVIRAQAFAPPLFPSAVITQTYLVNVGTSMPLMSIVTDPSNLWGPTGIYYAELSGPVGERPCSVEYWEARGVPGFSIPCGLRMRGGASQSRSDIAKKSFQLKFRRLRGPTKLEYPIIPSTTVDRFDSLALRANYNDSWTHWDRNMQRYNATYVRDQLTRDLRSEMGDLASHGTHCMLYLNGHMWGIYNPCEHVDADFLASYSSGPNWDLLSLTDTPGACQLEEGDRVAWDAFYNWFSTNDLSNNTNYQTLRSMMDLKNYTNYFIDNIWQYNNDWPHHNGFVARQRLAGAKWIFIDWDVEYGLGGGPNGGTVGSDMYGRATSSNWRITQLFSRLLTNANYRIYYAQRMDILFNTVCHEPHVLQRMNERAAEICPGIPQETQWALVWGDIKTQADWEAALQRMRNYINARTNNVRQQTRNRIAEITGWMDVKVLPAVGGEGDVVLHDAIRPTSYPWAGTFFRGIPLMLCAEPKPGYVFQGWSDLTIPQTQTTSVVLTAAHGTTYTIFARFGIDPNPPSIVKVEFVARNRMVVTFSRAVMRPSAETVTNYTVDHGVGNPTTATLQTSPTLVLLEFASNLTPATNYELDVINVQPQVGNPIPSGSPVVAYASFTVPPVVVSEIMYNSIGPDVEWVELHNTTGAPVSIGGWCVTDDHIFPAVTEGSWIFPPSTVIPARGYLVMGIDDDQSRWDFLPGVPLVMPLIAHGGNLKNSGDTVALFNSSTSGTLIDGSLSVPFPDAAVAGRSLEKRDDDFPWSGHPLAWRQCPVPIEWNTAIGTHATPGWGKDTTLAAPAMMAEPAWTSGTQNTVTWSTVYPTIRYTVQCDDAAGFLTPVQSADVVSTTPLKNFTGLVDGQTYYYRVKARYGALGESPWSNVVSSRQDAVGPTPPGTPTDAGTFTSSTTIRFDWTAATDSGSGVARYDVQIGTGPGLNNAFDGNVGAALNKTVTGAHGQTLYARVRARDGVGNIGPWSGNSNGISIDTIAPTLPGTPTDAGVYSSSTAVRFGWTAAMDAASGVASYDLQVGTAPGMNNVFDGNVGITLIRTVTGAHGQTLYARARARDAVGNIGAWSPASDGITVDTVRPRLAGVTVVNPATLDLTFDEPVRNADQMANYLFTGGLTLLSVTRLSDTQYRLATTNQQTGTSYTLTVKSGVRDRAGNPMDPTACSRGFVGVGPTGAESWRLYR